jgi:hypothetical protein
MSRESNIEYEIIVQEISESDTPLPLVASVQIQAISPAAAAAIMSDLLISIAKHNAIDISKLNTNLYRTQWINGI